MSDAAEDIKNDIETIKKLVDNESLLDVLIQIENFIDTLDVYVYKNWIKGQLSEGPFVDRHWVSVTFKWKYKEMPDPKGGLRLEKHGAKIYYKKTTEKIYVQDEKKNKDSVGIGSGKKMDLKDLSASSSFENQVAPTGNQPNVYGPSSDIEEISYCPNADTASKVNTPYTEKTVYIWLVTIKLPKRFIQIVDEVDIEYDDDNDDIDQDAVNAAKDEGLDDVQQDQDAEDENPDDMHDDVDAEEENPL